MFSFVAGLALLVFGVLLRSEGDDRSTARAPFDLRSPTMAAASNTADPAVETASPIATAVPFDGRVARMIAPSIGVDHAIEEVGLVANQLDVPKDGVRNIGWYDIYEQPGHGKNAVFAAHVNFDRKDGPFARLKDIEQLATISVVMQDGPTYVYEVVVYRQYDVETIPTGELIAAPDRPAGEEWITLITCGGQFVADPGSEFGHYQQRDVVIARRIE